jgi:hypothetical protein
MKYTKTHRDNFTHTFINLDYKICCGRLIYCKTIKQRVLLNLTYQKECVLHLNSRPPDCNVPKRVCLASELASSWLQRTKTSMPCIWTRVLLTATYQKGCALHLNSRPPDSNVPKWVCLASELASSWLRGTTKSVPCIWIRVLLTPSYHIECALHLNSLPPDSDVPHRVCPASELASSWLRRTT